MNHNTKQIGAGLCLNDSLEGKHYTKRIIQSHNDLLRMEPLD